MGVSPRSYRLTIYVIASAGCEAAVKSWVVRATFKQLRKRQLAPCPADSLTTLSESTTDLLNFLVVLFTSYFLSCLSQAQSLLSTRGVICVLQTTETHTMLPNSQAEQKYQLLNPPSASRWGGSGKEDSRNRIGSRNFSRSVLKLELQCGDATGFSSSLAGV